MQHVPRGFTLLELMVVLVIIGICTAGIGLGLGSLLDPARQLRQEAERLAQRLQVARDEARIDGRPLRWQADAAGYRFSRREGTAGWTCNATTCCAHSHGNRPASWCSRPPG